jgi:hypothetical protein
MSMEGSARMPLIRKERAGSDSFGNTWSEDGATVDVEAEHAAALLAIPDGGFSEVTPAGEDDGPGEPPQDPAADDPEENKELSEVDPDAPADEPEAKPAAKKTAARKTTARKSVEEG